MHEATATKHELLVNNIMEHRRMLSLGTTELEDKANLSKGLLSRWKRGMDPSFFNVLAVAEVLGASLDILAGREIHGKGPPLKQETLFDRIWRMSNDDELAWQSLSDHKELKAALAEDNASVMRTDCPGVYCKFVSGYSVLILEESTMNVKWVIMGSLEDEPQIQVAEQDTLMRLLRRVHEETWKNWSKQRADALVAQIE